MNKAWRIVSGISLLCLVIGVIAIGVGFFTGSSPVIIQNHGSLTEYAQRLNTNWAIVQQNISALLAGFGLG
jgi:hypothetical protein